MIKDLEVSVTANAEAPVSRDFSPIPKGAYKVKLIEVADWKPRTLKNVKLIAYDDHYQKLKDASGNDITDLKPSIDIYETNLKFEVVDGAYKGRWIFHRASTHPNRPWEIPNLLAGFGVPTIKLSNLKTLVGEEANVKVDIDSYMKSITDPETGMEEKVKVEFNVIKRFERKEEDLDI